MVGLSIQYSNSGTKTLDLTQYPNARWAEVVEVKVGETLEVKLRENPSTGFRWLVLDQLLKKNSMHDVVKESNASF